MFKIALNAGHGLNTAGKRCLKSLDKNETREWELNSRICNKIEEKLKEYDGYQIIRLDDTSGKTDIALKTRTDKANEFGTDFYLAIHHNLGSKCSASGGVIAITYTNANAVTRDWQKALYDSIIKYTGLKGNRSQPLQKRNMHEVRESKMPAVLLECGFMDSETDVPIILTDSFADKVATACVEVLVAKGSLKKKSVTVEYPESTANYFNKYTGNTQSLTDALKSIGEQSSFAYRSKIAKKNGITSYLGLARQNLKMLDLLKQGKLMKP
jgi:N-acetylmuramoyl-L-alanine amidase